MDLTVTSAKFEHIYRSLVLSDVKRQLAPLFTPEGISENDIAYALSTASRLSLVGLESNLEDAVAVRKAYDVATRSLFFGNGAGRVF